MKRNGKDLPKNLTVIDHKAKFATRNTIFCNRKDVSVIGKGRAREGTEEGVRTGRGAHNGLWWRSVITAPKGRNPVL